MRPRNAILLGAAGLLAVTAVVTGFINPQQKQSLLPSAAVEPTFTNEPKDSPEPATTAPQRNINQNTLFLQRISSNESIPPTSYNQAFELAQSSCDSLETGASMKQLSEAVTSKNTGAEDQIKFIVDAGVRVYCPQFENQLGEL